MKMEDRRRNPARPAFHSGGYHGPRTQETTTMSRAFPLPAAPAVLSLLAALVLEAAPRTAAGQAPALQAPVSPALRPEEPVIAVSFPGGTVAEYLEAVKRSAGDLAEVNVVLDGEAAGSAMPPAELRKVRVEDAIHLIPAIARSGSGQPLEFTEVAREPTPVYVLRVETAPGKPPPGGSPGADFGAMASPGGSPAVQNGGLKLDVFSLRSLIEPGHGAAEDARRLTAETILSALEQALAEANQGSPASLKYHAESYLLMVRGTPAQLEVVRQVLETLSPGHRPEWMPWQTHSPGGEGVPGLSDVPIVGDLFRKPLQEGRETRDALAERDRRIEDLREKIAALEAELKSLREELQASGKEGKRP